MAQAFDYGTSRESLQMVARLAKAYAAKLYRPDAELAADQMIQGNASGHHVTSRLAGSEFDAVLLPERLDSLSFDQGQFKVRFRLVEGSLAVGVAVAFQADTGSGFRLLHGTHWLSRSGGDMY